MSELQPSLERLADLHRVDPKRPLVLLELVRYAERAGRDEYARLLAGHGGRIRFRGRVELQFIGRPDGAWDDFLIVEFRSRAGFMEGLAPAPDLGGILAARRCHAAHPGPRALLPLAALAGRLLTALGAGPAPLSAEQARARSKELVWHGARALGPDLEQLQAFAAGEPDVPVVMFNLLAYRERAHYEPGVPDADVSGREAYQRYGRGVARLLLGAGARPLWLGRAETTLVGDPDAWDEFAVVEYPSRAAFFAMVSSTAYQAQLHHRDAGLARTELIQCARDVSR